MKWSMLISCAILAGCSVDHRVPPEPVGPPPAFNWQTSAALDNVNAPTVRTIE